MPNGKPLSREKAEETLALFQEQFAAGFRAEKDCRRKTIVGQAAVAARISVSAMHNRIESIRRHYPDIAEEMDAMLAAPLQPFDVREAVVRDGPIEALLDAIEHRHDRRTEAAQQVIPVEINMDGPIAVAIIGDIHIDDPGCAMGPLRRDTELVASTAGMFAVAVGDYRNNWVGRLTKLWAEQPVTQSQALRLIEWWFGACGGKLIAGVQGNHDAWNCEGGDAVAILHRLCGMHGLYGEPAYRLALRLPSGAEALMHVRHDFPGRSQFNAAHGQVRETLFGYRDHIIACGDRHHSGYIPIWHNDPARLCHGLRVGCYKDFDKFATEKGFRWENWARSMVVIIDPRFAHDPVEFVSVRFSVVSGAAELTRRRQEWAAKVSHKRPNKTIKAKRREARGSRSA